VFHTLELPKCRLPRDNARTLEPLEKWVYFLQHAEQLEADELARRLVDQEFREAAGVLEMISQSPEDRQYYEARLKFLHDAEARLIAAREAGREEGREEGLLAGKIQLLQELLGEHPTSLQSLISLSRSELATRILELQTRLRQRGV
jgi:predicted transposase/invertase (TIGR01784 family)